MRLRIIEVNFLKSKDWVFKLSSDELSEVYVMNETFYRKRRMESPITKHELDSLDVGHWVNAIVVKMEDVFVVTGLYK